ncbi:heme biosynthesis protein HemY [Roseovarius faecimaris]|uniref:Heme biosynthesis protein HemY n=1 Tax=Roseovarius faecimaris TaxID=2494550 RepID=A0A6I6IX63_9RHOB|nr:heme biosynthesis HemY N-terminal domain-containing protein [Roseovarius faecimaris]QGY00182.1 heme biosynthesis protein HemY [Roseovarius faecimaris]
MLWSIIKIVVFIALVAAAAYGAGHLLELEGGVRIQMAGLEFNLTPLMSVIVLILLVLAIWILLKLASLLIAVLKFINGDDTALSRYFQRNREEKGYRALSEGVMALASGEGDVAMAQAAKAEKYLRKPALTNLITAQAAEMKGDRRKAEEVYKRLLTNEKTRFVGVRGIMRQKLQDGDTETALKLAETAFALKPKHVEVQDTLLQLQARKADWKGARETLKAKLKHGSLPRDVHKRRDAVLALSEAKGVLDEGNTIEAREAAIEANRLSPDLVPAAAMAARSYIEQGSKRYATRVLKKAWDAQPHPDLAAAFAEIEPDETPEARIKRFVKLTKSMPDHRETKLLNAELHIAAEDFPAARRALGDLAESAPDARALTIMAAIERGEGAPDAVVKGWLARALSAPRGPQWVCDKCHYVHAQWAPACENCHSFDTLSWTTPPESPVSTATGVEMLPLIVGTIEDQSKDAAPEPDETEIVDAELVDDAETDPSDASEAEVEKK